MRFVVPPGWRIVSALEATTDSAVFRARDYHTLVDAPALLGNVQLVPFEVEGKPHMYAIAPAGSVAGDIQEYATKVAAVIRVQSAIFGGLPYDKYVIFYVSPPGEAGTGAALEHLNSYVAVGVQGVGGLPGGAAHEVFHAWNVKRIRPAEMWPYDYARPNVSPSLWVSEGITTYYAAVSLRRAGLTTVSMLLRSLAGAVSSLESNEARHYESPSLGRHLARLRRARRVRDLVLFRGARAGRAARSADPQRHARAARAR